MTNSTSGWEESDSKFFIENGEILTPSRAEQFDTIAQLIPLETDEEFIVADLACGAGLLSAAILEYYPRCRVLALDGSPAMLQAARDRLSHFSGRVRFEVFDLFDRGWMEQLPGDLRCVVSSLAIHHLDGAEKKALFRGIYHRLPCGGALLIADIVEPVNKFARLVYAGSWDRAVRKQSRRVTGSKDVYDRFSEGWNHFVTPDLEFDKPSGLFEQLRWLSDAGFSQVDCFWLRAGHAIYGGYR
ncbi:MAG TPA: methyltransferase domain-containing protein [Chloroflexota bacterium]